MARRVGSATRPSSVLSTVCAEAKERNKHNPTITLTILVFMMAPRAPYTITVNSIPTADELQKKVNSARERLDAHVREIVAWHFDPATGCPFWLDYAAKLKWNPRKEIRTYADLDRFDNFNDEWLRGGPVRRWVPKAYEGRPIFVFETGGSTGVPKSRINIDDFRTDYEDFSTKLPDEHFPKGADRKSTRLN